MMKDLTKQRFTTMRQLIAIVVGLVAIAGWVWTWSAWNTNVDTRIDHNSKATIEALAHGLGLLDKHAENDNIHMTMEAKIKAFVLREEFNRQASVRSQEMSELRSDIRNM